MRLISRLMIIILCGISASVYVHKNVVIDKSLPEYSSDLAMQKNSHLKTKVVPPQMSETIAVEDSLFKWMGKSVEDLVEQWGKPIRKDRSAYGYTWYIYTDEKKHHLQFGVLDKKIVTIFALGEGVSIHPLSIGQTYDSVDDDIQFVEEVVYQNGSSTYKFHLSGDDLRMRPLAKVGEDMFVQCYFDTYTNKLSSIRIVNGEILLKHRPYKIHYRGSLSERPHISREGWKEIESGMERQIFEITNVLRSVYGKDYLHWESHVSDVAFLHSKDMALNDYFSHTSLNGQGLKERLQAKKIVYLSAGENIAAQYPDAPSVVIGWLNSEDHRRALLSEQYTHLGVGVYELYYTQNFVEKPF